MSYGCCGACRDGPLAGCEPLGSAYGGCGWLRHPPADSWRWSPPAARVVGFAESAELGEQGLVQLGGVIFPAAQLLDGAVEQGLLLGAGLVLAGLAAQGA